MHRKSFTQKENFEQNYSSATISAPPTTNTPGGSAIVAGQEPPKVSAMIPSTGATSKIMHPPEDLSLEEIRARKPKYLKKVTTAIANAISSNAQHQQQHQQQQHHQQQQQQMQMNQVKNINKKLKLDNAIHTFF